MLLVLVSGIARRGELYELQSLWSADRFFHGLDATTIVKSRESGVFCPEEFGEIVNKPGLMQGHTIRLKKRLVEDASHDYEADYFWLPRHECLVDLLFRRGHSLTLGPFLFWKKRVAGEPTSCKRLPMGIAILFLLSKGRFDALVGIDGNKVGIRIKVHSGGLADVFHSLCQNENSVAGVNKGQRFFDFVCYRYPRSFRELQLFSRNLVGLLGGYGGSVSGLGALRRAPNAFSRNVGLLNCDGCENSGNENEQTIEDDLESLTGYPFLDQGGWWGLLALGLVISLFGGWQIYEGRIWRGIALWILVFPIVFAAVSFRLGW